MKVIVAVVVYDRYDNLKEWIRCFKLADTENTELIIIHNFRNDDDKLKFGELCIENQIKYISRRNI